MYEPDSSSSSVVSSTSRSPQHPQSQSQPHAGIEPVWAKPSYNGGGGSPTVTTNGDGNEVFDSHGHTQMEFYMAQAHDHYGNGMLMDQTQQQQHWLGSTNEGMEILKKDATATKELTVESEADGAHTHAHADSAGSGEAIPTTTAVNKGTGYASNTAPSSSSATTAASAVQLQDQPEQSSNLSSTQNLSPTKTKPPKLCQACGDKAKSFHFGGLSCDSCKAFFRRSVHNDAYKAFQCVYQRACEITISTRKSCQACRFKKCLAIGMETNWVMTEEERSQLQKQRSEKKESGLTASGKASTVTGDETTPLSTGASAASAAEDADTDADFEPNVAEMLKYMTAAERDEIEAIVNKYQHSYREIPFRVSAHSGTRKTVEIIQMFTTILRRFAYFTKLIPEFAALEHGDQSTLLRAGVLEMCLLRSALAFDMKNNRWPKTENMEFLKDCPQLRVEDMERLVSKDLYQMHMQFINGIQELKVDEPTVMILLLIVLFYPERGPLQQQEIIAKVQEKYLLLLNKYVQWRFGPRAGKVFPKLLTRLADLRQLNDFHTEYNLKMTKTEVEEIQEQLGNINLNPYPQWVLVDGQQKSAAAASVGGSMPAMQMHSAHAYADTSGDQDRDHGQHPAAAYMTSTPSPDFQVQDVHMQGPPEQVLQQQQISGMVNFAGQMPMPYAANAGAPRQFPVNGAAAAGGIPQMPNMRQLFMQFVSQRIPTLITNPFATFPMDNEMSGAAAFFEQMSAAAAAGVGGGAPPSLQQIQSLMASAGGGLGQVQAQEAAAMAMGMGMGAGAGDQQHLLMGGMPSQSQAHQQQHAHADPSGSVPQISQICNILESSDPDTLRQLKDSLSPNMVAKLSTIFGGSGGGGGAGSLAATEFLSSGSFDPSKIPPELIQSFLAGGSGEPNSASGTSSASATGMMSAADLSIGGLSGYQQHQQQYATAGYSHSGGSYSQAQPQPQDTYQDEHQHQQLDLSASNWGGGLGGVQVVLEHHQQSPIMAEGVGVDFTSAAFLTHRHQAQQQPHAHHFDPASTEPRYGNGSAGTASRW